MRRRWACAVFALLLFAPPLQAQDVTLRSFDGGIEITGEFLGFDGEFYRIDTVYGELTVDGAGVTCEGPGCPDLENFVAELQLSGSPVLGEIMLPALLEAFAARIGLVVKIELDDGTMTRFVLRNPAQSNPVARVEVAATTADEGFADLLANQADMVLSTREIRPGERELAREAGMGDLTRRGRSQVIALDALVPVVSPANPVPEISPQDLARVLSGGIVNWQVLGGPDASIAVHLPDRRTGLGQSVEDRLLFPAGLERRQDVIQHERSRDVVSAVMQDPFALGVASFAEMGDAKPLTLTGGCGFRLTASRHSIKTEDYPLTAPLFLYLPARRLPEIGRDFLAFLRTPPAQLVIRRAGFVDQTPEEIGIDAQGRRLSNAIAAAGTETALAELQRMVDRLAPRRRLTTSFRFEAGSVRLDAQSRSNVEQLARALEQGTYDARGLLFVGFSDGVGAAEANRTIALRRAESVRRAVVSTADPLDLRRLGLETDAFGEALPLACDDSTWGRQANRRVEVWVR